MIGVCFKNKEREKRRKEKKLSFLIFWKLSLKCSPYKTSLFVYAKKGNMIGHCIFNIHQGSPTPSRFTSTVFRKKSHFLLFSSSSSFSQMSMKEESAPLLKSNKQERALIPRSTSTCSQIMILQNNHTEATATKKKLMFACTLAFLFFITEVTAGYLANSLGKNCLEIHRRST